MQQPVDTRYDAAVQSSPTTLVIAPLLIRIFIDILGFHKNKMTTEGSDEEQASKSSSPTIDAPHSETANSAASHHPDLQPAQEAAAATDGKENATSPDEPPLPDEEAPPLPDEPPPNAADDGWEAKWEETAKAWYFYNHRTGVTQWENPRLPASTVHSHGPYDRFANFYYFLCSFPA